jgi:hypothetical protein
MSTVDLVCHKVLQVTVLRYLCVCLVTAPIQDIAKWKQSLLQSFLAGFDYNFLYQQLVNMSGC